MSVASRIGLQLGLSDSASRLTLPTITRHAGKFLLSFAKWWTIGWLGYYLITDLNRRLTIRRRARELQATLSKPLHKGSRGSVNGDYASDQEPLGPLGVSRKEKEALKKQFASLHFLGRYWNPFAEWREQGAWEAIFNMLTSIATFKILRSPGDLPNIRPVPGLENEAIDFVKLHGKGDELQVGDEMTYTWIGQSTAYVQLDGLCILTDPQFSERTLDSRIAPKRIRELPCSLEDLKTIDVVLVSHNHYDHLDVLSIRTIGNSATWFIPKGMRRVLLDNGVSDEKIVELDWWSETTFRLPRNGREYRMQTMPNMHWTARTPLDTNTSLSCCWFVKSLSVKTSRTSAGQPKHRSLFHVGDTGYSPTLFPAIGRVLDEEIDCAVIPIGSYKPLRMMHLQHTDPEGSVKIARDLQARKSFAAHWGTWIMSDEPYDQPPKDLAIARRKIGLDDDVFEVLPAGRTVVVP